VGRTGRDRPAAYDHAGDVIAPAPESALGSAAPRPGRVACAPPHHRRATSRRHPWSRLVGPIAPPPTRRLAAARDHAALLHTDVPEEGPAPRWSRMPWAITSALPAVRRPALRRRNGYGDNARRVRRTAFGVARRRRVRVGQCCHGRGERRRRPPEPLCRAQFPRRELAVRGPRRPARTTARGTVLPVRRRSTTREGLRRLAQRVHRSSAHPPARRDRQALAGLARRAAERHARLRELAQRRRPRRLSNGACGTRAVGVGRAVRHRGDRGHERGRPRHRVSDRWPRRHRRRRSNRVVDRARLGRRAGGLAAERYTAEAVVPEIEEIYESVLARTKAGVA